MNEQQSTSTKRHRSAKLSLWLTPDDKAEFSRRAGMSGLSKTDFLLLQCLNMKPLQKRRKAGVDEKLLLQTLGQIGRLGNNINQLAKHANSGYNVAANDNLQIATEELRIIRDMIRQSLGYPSDKGEV